MRLAAREAWLAPRFVGAAFASAAAGIAIAAMDSSPGFDDTGVTAGALVVTAFVGAAVAGRRAWLIALLVGVWTPLTEIPHASDPTALAALVFATVGALAGGLVARGTGLDA